MNHAFNSKPPADLGWKVIDQALDDLQRSASRAKTWNEFAAALSNALPSLGIACWSTWRQGGNGWICKARGPESLPTNSNDVELVVKAARLLSDRESDERTPTHVSDTSEQKSADAITSPASRSCTILQRVAVPFRPESSIDGVFIACFASDVREDTGRARIGLLNAIVDLVAQFELRRAFRDQQVAASAKNTIDDLQRRIHSSLRLHQIALLLVHDGRIALGCDRVIVTVTRRGHQCVEAVTGVDKPSRASLSLRALASLCEYVASSGERLTFISPQDNAQDSPAHWPETFLRELDHYREHSPFQSLIIEPIEIPASEADGEPDEGRATDSTSNFVLGTLVLENFREPISPQVATNLLALLPHVALAIANALSVSRIPGYRLWIRPTTRFAPSRWRTSLAIWSIVLASIACILGLPAELAVPATGKLQSITRREIFAPQDGIVETVYVDHGQSVAMDQMLIGVRSADLDLRIQQASATRDSLSRQLLSVQNQRLQISAADQSSRFRALELASQEEQLQLQISAHAESLALLEKRREMLQIRSPISGRVLSWGPQERLTGRPIRKGDSLLSLADDRGEFELELQVPDRLAGRVLSAANDANGGHRVHWALSNRPESRRLGTVTDVARQFELNETGASYLRLRVAIEPKLDAGIGKAPTEVGGSHGPESELRSGEVVTAKIDCGRTSFAEAQLFEMIDTLRRWWILDF